MNRHLLLACLTAALPFAALVTAPMPAQAQSARAYAPENLRPLSRSDQIRVIEREYSDQSRGSRIPDDQMRFYLDQINSGWGFSRIKQDIASSLGGGNGNWNGNDGWNSGGGSVSGTIRCESTDNRQRVCTTGWRGATLVRQLSKAQCIEGRNWGSGNGTVWVNNGCRAEFAQGRGGWAGNSGAGNVIRCESQDNRERVCNTGWRRGATLVRQLSKAQCIEGRNWGQRNGAVWVSNGCRAEFSEGRGGGWGWGNGNGQWNGGNSNYSVTCNSENNRQRSCAWDRRQGRPVVIQQISSTRCVEGRNWGVDGNAIWVNGGCRARFGAR